MPDRFAINNPITLQALPVNTKADGWDIGARMVTSADGLVYTRWGMNSVAFVVDGNAVKRIEEPRLGHIVYSADGRPLEAVIGELLRSRQLTLSVAESCSGGLLSSRITDVPGSSDYFDRGAVCYSNQSKEEWLGVPGDLIATHGAVSEPVATAMASGIADRARSDVGIGITGIAGPGGGTPEKPVGTVAIAVKTPSASQVRTFQFLGGRDMVKFQSAQAAMNMLRLMLLDA